MQRPLERAMAFLHWSSWNCLVGRGAIHDEYLVSFLLVVIPSETLEGVWMFGDRHS